MADTFDFTEYVRKEPPPQLWRVQLPDAITTVDRKSGDIVAGDDTRVCSNMQDFRQSLACHFDWNCSNNSCFISTFSDHKHAFNWATQRFQAWAPSSTNIQSGPDWPVNIYEISTVRLPEGVHVFDTFALSERLQIHHTYHKHEYVFLHRVPVSAIVNTFTSLADFSAAEVNYNRGGIHQVMEGDDNEPRLFPSAVRCTHNRG